MKQHQRSGFTIVELLVSITILGILLALILPAVQQARGTARKLGCTNHLKQIGVALANAQEATGEFPSSLFCMIDLLPYVGHSAAYDAYHSEHPVNRLGIIPPISLYRCPDETVEHPIRNSEGRYVDQIPNYVINRGSLFPDFDGGASHNGFRIENHEPNVKPSDFTDGLSQTVAFSERLLPISHPDYPQEGIPSEEKKRRETGRYARFTEQAFNNLGEESQAINQCQNHRVENSVRIPGVEHSSVYTMRNGYQHMLPPNHVACINGPESMEYHSSAFNLIPPSSLHTGGVNVLFADGSVHFITNEIDLTVWQALGSRNGRESVNVSF